ncbi:glycosylphosphatidylinositol anchor attachment 1 protein-like [Diadema antillarum]|uniref:glycosylphosphatidylinositol anchor attachment 1 protein-like n=1 Tax=Diadema antillarum TaxID=105358 RepID=UPI003A887F24
MGLLTDTRTQAFMSRVILAVHKPLEVVLYIAGVLALLALAFTPLNEKTYFSENALLPGLVDRKYQSEQDVQNYAKELTRLAAVDGGRAKMPVEWLREQFTELGLDVFEQNFTVNHPFMEKGDRNALVDSNSGTNVYAILRAPRIASTEAMVITVPFRNKESSKTLDRNNFGIGLVLSVAKFFSRQMYWSKDIIFVIVDKEEVGMQAWLDGYHDRHSEYIQSSLMLGRSGGIIAAINLELGSELTDHIDVKIEGINGQLPNLDLFNLAVRLCRVERVPVTFQNRYNVPDRVVVKLEGLQHAATTMLLNMAKQASGNPSGIHGLFMRYHIEALTLQAHPSTRQGSSDTVAVGRVMEGIVRSVNNLLERFHQSFFFYILPGCERYISIGMYMIPFGLLLVVPTLHAMALWLLALSFPTTSDDTGDQDKDKDTKSTSGDISAKRACRPFGQVMPLLIGAHVVGAVLFVSPEYFLGDHIKTFGLTPKDAITVGFLAFFFGITTLPILGRRNNFRGNDDAPSDWQLLKSLTLIWYTIALLGVSMFNFSLAFFIAVPTIPVAVLVRPSSRRILTVFQGILLLIISPPALLFTFLCLHHRFLNPRTAPFDILAYGWQKTVDSFFDGVVNAYLFGNKMFALVALIWIPVWFLLWLVIFRKPNANHS